MQHGRQTAAFRRGSVVIISLVVATVLEYMAAVTITQGAFMILVVFAAIKAWLILQYFMHLSQLWQIHEE